MPGQFQSRIRQKSCNAIPCSKGMYGIVGGTSPDQTMCHSCQAGLYQNSTGQGSCFLCPSGLFVNAEGSTACTGRPCPEGKYGKLGSTRKEACRKCPSGKHQRMRGQLNCSVCAPGKYQYRSGSLLCKGGGCPAGYFGNTGASSFAQSACSPCPAGTYQSVKAQ